MAQKCISLLFLMSFGWSYVHKYLFATYISCQVTDMWSKFHKSKIGTKSCFAGAFHIHRQKSAAAGRYTHFTRQKNRFASYSTTQYYYSLFPNGKQSRVKTTFSQSSRARMFYGNFLWWFLLWHTNYHLVNVCDLALKQREGAIAWWKVKKGDILQMKSGNTFWQKKNRILLLPLAGR